MSTAPTNDTTDDTLVEWFIVKSFHDYCHDCNDAAGIIVFTNSVDGPGDQSALKTIAGDCILFEVCRGRREGAANMADALNCTVFSSLNEYVESLGWTMSGGGGLPITLHTDLPCDVIGCGS